jgi:hypothetical protein
MLASALLLLQATFQSPRLIESSGVVASRAHPGILWTHNDSGDRPYVYATNARGEDLGALLVPGATAIDWEDMALGPCPLHFPAAARDCLYFGDTGDNLEFRPFVTVYAVPEPDPPERASDTLGTTRAPAAVRLRYPEGAHDVEAIYVSPRDTALYLVSKGWRRGSAIRLYRIDHRAFHLPDTASTVTIASLVQTLDVIPNPESGRVVTGATIRPDGKLVAIRTYSEIFFYYPGVGGRLAPARETPCALGGLEAAGEAIDFYDDSTLVLTSEATARRRGTIDFVHCN